MHTNNSSLAQIVLLLFCLLGSGLVAVATFNMYLDIQQYQNRLSQPRPNYDIADPYFPY